LPITNHQQDATYDVNKKEQ